VPWRNHIPISAYVKSAKDFDTQWAPNELNPPILFAMDPFRQTRPDDATGGTPDERILSDVFHFLCPVTAPQKALHVFRDRGLAAEGFVDGITYDISSVAVAPRGR